MRVTWVTTALIVMGTLFSPSPSAAAVIDVPGDQPTIAAAVAAAAPGDTINIAAGTYGETLVITKDLTLQGAGQALTTIDGGGVATVVDVSFATVTLNDLTITNGAAAGKGGGITGSGAIVNVTRCRVTGNVSSAGGGIRMNGGALVLTDSIVDHNTTTGTGGGGIAMVTASASLTSSEVSDNQAANQGGGIWLLNGGVLDLLDTLVTRNTGLQGGGIFEGSSPGDPATVTLTDSHVDANTTTGGGLTALRGARTMVLVNSTVDGNIGAGVAAGDSLTMTNSSVSGNSERGVTAGGALSMTNSSVDGNGAASPAWGVHHTGVGAGSIVGSTISNNAGHGIRAGSAGGLTIENSTVSGNYGASRGGGIFVTSGSPSVVELDSVTITNNSVVQFPFAGSGTGGGILNLSDASVTLVSTILAGNSAEVAAPDCSGMITSNGYTLVGDTTGCAIMPAPPGGAGDVFDVADPLLDVLADNGGPTQTHALLDGSPAIDGGDVATCPAVDQRGISRTAFGPCDMGSFELDTVVDADGDGIPDENDLCPNSDLSPTVVIDGCDSGVPNVFDAVNGCSLSDEIAALAAGANNHGQFTSSVAKLLNMLKKDGIITGDQHGAIQSCAGSASVP